MTIFIQFVSHTETLKLRARSKTSNRKDVSDGLFTRPVYVGNKSIAWPLHEIEAINAARLAGKNDDEIKQIVDGLHILREGK